MTTRRQILTGSLAALPLAFFGRQALGQASTTLKISHQFPGGTIDSGDFRDRLCRKFAVDVEARTKGALKFQIYPNSSLMKTVAQFSALRKSALDMSLYPIPYAGGEVPELNIGLMPGLVTSYEQAATWKNAEVGKALNDLLLEKGIVMVSWVWQAGGVASRAAPLINPEDAKGMKVRGGSKEMDMILKAAGAAVLSLPSNELYAAMQTGAADAGMTSSTSLISFRLEEVSKHLTTGRGKAYWFMLEPLLMARSTYDKLTKEQQQIVMQIGAEMEKFGTEQARIDDKQVADIYTKAGAKVYDLDDRAVKRWQTLARETAWKDYAEKSANCARLLSLAEKTL